MLAPTGTSELCGRKFSSKSFGAALWRYLRAFTVFARLHGAQWIRWVRFWERLSPFWHRCPREPAEENVDALRMWTS